MTFQLNDSNLLPRGNGNEGLGTGVIMAHWLVLVLSNTIVLEITAGFSVLVGRITRTSVFTLSDSQVHE